MSNATDSRGEARQRNRNRWMLVGIAGLFLGPLLLAFILYFSNLWTPEALSVNGELFEPIRPLPLEKLEGNPGAPSLRGSWSLIILVPDQCGEPCATAIQETGQVWKALGKDRDRVQGIWFATGNLATLPKPTDEKSLILKGITPKQPGHGAVLATIGEYAPGDVMLVDPLGNLLLRFPRGTGMRAMHTDLQKLLRVSRIG